VVDLVNKTVDFDLSESRQRLSVKMGIDPELDRLKRQYDGMDSFLTEVASHINQQVPAWARECIQSCVFLPQLGFLTVVESGPFPNAEQCDMEVSEDAHWQKVFTADNNAFYKNQYMRELDDRYGDMYCEIGGKCGDFSNDTS
jgi:DNA mismatch repair protein MSH5